MREQGMETVLISGDALVTDEYWAITGDAGNGTLMTFGPDPRKSADAAGVVDEFRKTGYEPEGYTLYTYGAIQAYAQAVAKVGGTDPDKVAEALKSMQFNTVMGTYGFDSKGDVTAPGYVFYAWKNGTYGYASEM
jgi:branched-chain amino acid transport system substrate-binding protein